MADTAAPIEEDVALDDQCPVSNPASTQMSMENPSHVNPDLPTPPLQPRPYTM